jgi:diadenosine tetraphosphate (Ap4A) HIT family hydrolase
MRHVESLSELSGDEYAGLWELVREFQITLSDEFNPDGFNIGVNDGREAGQTIMHAHVHLIPRYKGDVPDPRGGIRWVIPEKTDYWTAP